MSQMFVRLQGRPAFYCPGCKALHMVPWGAEIQGTDAQPTIVAQNQVVPVRFGPNCTARMRAGVLHFDLSCGHTLKGEDVALMPVPTLQPQVGLGSYSTAAA